MRWILVDRFLELEKGSYAKTIKNVTLGEDHIHDQFPNYPIMPNTLIIEAMAQTGGILAGYSLGFKRQIFLAKIEKVTFNDIVIPGDQMIMQAWVDDLREEGCRVKAQTSVGDKVIAQAYIMFVGLENPNGNNGSPKKIGKDFIFASDLLAALGLKLDNN